MQRDWDKFKQQQQQKLREFLVKTEAQRKLHCDSDFDGITDVKERIIGINPYSVDTDKNGYTDLEELSLNLDPRRPDRPREKQIQQQNTLEDELEL